MRAKAIIWRVAILIMVSSLLWILNTYMQDSLKIKALTERAECIADMKNAFQMEDKSAICEDILNYRSGK